MAQLGQQRLGKSRPSAMLPVIPVGVAENSVSDPVGEGGDSKRRIRPDRAGMAVPSAT